MSLRKTLVAGAALAVLGAMPAAAGSYRLMFDAFSPAGIDCQATPGPGGGAVRISRSVLGKPVIWMQGDVRGAEITCSLPDGSRWQGLAQRAIPPGTGQAEATVALRPGAQAVMTILDTSEWRSVVIPRSFVRVQ